MNELIPTALLNRYLNRSTMANATVPQLMEQAEKYLDNFAFDQAESCLRRVLAMEQSNTKAMDLLGELLMENGLPDQAKEVSFTRVNSSLVIIDCRSFSKGAFKLPPKQILRST